MDLINKILFNMTIKEIEELVIRKRLETCGNNLTRTGYSLGISRATMYRKAEQYGIER